MSMIPSAPDDPQRKLAANERLKLTASGLNTLATAMITIGVLAPLAALIYSPVNIDPSRPVWSLLLSAACWATVGGTHHHVARKLVGRLVP